MNITPEIAIASGGFIVSIGGFIITAGIMLKSNKSGFKAIAESQKKDYEMIAESNKKGFEMVDLKFNNLIQVLSVERDGMKKGLMTMVNKSAMPISFDWFEKYGDLLVVGMFPLESGNKIIRGYVFAVRFQDLIDSQGNLRRFSQAIGPGTPPLAHVRPYYAKPTAKQYQLAKAIELKPGSKPLVIVRNSNSGPIVEMEQVKVSPKNAETFVCPIRHLLAIHQSTIGRRFAALLVLKARSSAS